MVYIGKSTAFLAQFDDALLLQITHITDIMTIIKLMKDGSNVGS
jgi:hypothetical protein